MVAQAPVRLVVRVRRRAPCRGEEALQVGPDGAAQRAVQLEEMDRAARRIWAVLQI